MIYNVLIKCEGEGKAMVSNLKKSALPPVWLHKTSSLWVTWIIHKPDEKIQG